nr:ribonuclease H-like domain-containing protein [Tanacetum cinerariifolium]
MLLIYSYMWMTSCSQLRLLLSYNALLHYFITKFAEEILERAHMQHCNPCKTLVDTESKLSSDGDCICLYMHDPHDPHFSALKRILCYVRGTINHGLQLHVSSTSQLTTYTDADWADCPVTRRSTSGYCVFLGDNLLSWSAKRQVTLSRSSAEAEYRGVVNVVAKTAWLRNLLLELHAPLSTAILVYCDNVSAVYLSTNPVKHQRTKYTESESLPVPDRSWSYNTTIINEICTPLAPQTPAGAFDQLNPTSSEKEPHELPRLKPRERNCTLTRMGNGARCGDSQLCEDLYKEDIIDLTFIDLSSVEVSKMHKHLESLYPLPVFSSMMWNIKPNHKSTTPEGNIVHTHLNLTCGYCTILPKQELHSKSVSAIKRDQELSNFNSEGNYTIYPQEVASTRQLRKMSMSATRNEKELLLNQLELGATGTIVNLSYGNDAFNYVEMDMVVSEVQRVKERKCRGGTIIGIKVGDDSILLDGLSQI